MTTQLLPTTTLVLNPYKLELWESQDLKNLYCHIYSLNLPNKQWLKDYAESKGQIITVILVTYSAIPANDVRSFGATLCRHYGFNFEHRMMTRNNVTISSAGVGLKDKPYVYILSGGAKGNVFYVGKGTNNRATDHSAIAYDVNSDAYHKPVYEHIRSLGGVYNTKIVKICKTHNEAYAWEYAYMLALTATGADLKQNCFLCKKCTFSELRIKRMTESVVNSLTRASIAKKRKQQLGTLVLKPNNKPSEPIKTVSSNCNDAWIDRYSPRKKAAGRRDNLSGAIAKYKDLGLPFNSVIQVSDTVFTNGSTVLSLGADGTWQVNN